MALLSVVPLEGVLSPLTEALGEGLGKATSWLASDGEEMELAWEEGAEGVTTPEVGTFNKSEADLLYDRLGPAYLSNPEEYASIMQQLEAAGVDIVEREGVLAFQPGPVGDPGRIILDQEASIGALRHEFQHFLDYQAAGFPGLGPYLNDFESYVGIEANGYDQEIRTAIETGNQDLVPAIYRQLLEATKNILKWAP